MWNPETIFTGVLYGGVGGLLLGGLFTISGRFEAKRKMAFDEKVERARAQAKKAADQHGSVA